MKKGLESSTKGATATLKSPGKTTPAKKAAPTLPRIGVHVSVAGGLENAFVNAAAAGCDCIQIFVKNQRQWRAKPLGDEQVKAFFEAKSKSTINPIIAHASYLLNLAAPSQAVRELSMNSMVDELVRCEALHIEGLVFHPGAHCEGEVRNPFGYDEEQRQPGNGAARQQGKEVQVPKFDGRKQSRDRKGVVEKISSVISRANSDRECTEFGEHMLAGIERIALGIDEVHKRCAGFKTKLLLECTAGQGSAIGWQFEQLAEILKRVCDPSRVDVCLDTCHLFAAGYDFRKPEGYAAMIDHLDRTIGIAQVKCIHCNDSKRELGSRVDRHDHIGKGQIGQSAFANFLNDHRFREVPFILETPKEKDDRGRDCDVVNVKTLRRLVR
jgi:endonuclease IV